MKLFLIFSLLLVIGCNKDITKTEEYNLLLKENEELKAEIEELKYTPEMRYVNAEQELETGNREVALKLFDEISSKYTGTEYAIKSEKKSKEIRNEIQKEIDEKERLQKEKELEEKRKKELGFKLLKPRTKIILDELTLTFSDIKFYRSFVFDSYSDTYHYRTSDRGYKYLLAKATITSKSNNPRLPTVVAYTLEDGSLKLLTSRGLEYRFRRWGDYGSYLGNYSDYGNDFSKTSTVRFNLGRELSINSYKGKKVYLVLSKARNISRSYDRFKSPPASYSGYTNVKNELTVDDFDEDGGYILIKIIQG